MSDNFGTEMDIETATANVAVADFRDLAFYESLCEVDESGRSGLQKQYESYFDNHVLVGLADADDKEAVLAACDSSYLEKAIALYKETNGLA